MNYDNDDDDDDVVRMLTFDDELSDCRRRVSDAVERVAEERAGVATLNAGDD